MEFLAIVKYSHGGKITSAFACPLERLAFLKTLRESDPNAKVRLKTRTAANDYPPADEADWYEAHSQQKGDAI